MKTIRIWLGCLGLGLGLALVLSACATTPGSGPRPVPSVSQLRIVSSNHDREGAHRVIILGSVRNDAGVRANAIRIHGEVLGPNQAVLGQGHHTIGVLAPGEVKTFRMAITGVPHDRAISHRVTVVDAQF